MAHSFPRIKLKHKVTGKTITPDAIDMFNNMAIMDTSMLDIEGHIDVRNLDEYELLEEKE